MICAFSPILNAHQTRKPICAFNAGALREKQRAFCCAFAFPVKAHQTRKRTSWPSRTPPGIMAGLPTAKAFGSICLSCRTNGKGGLKELRDYHAVSSTLPHINIKSQHGGITDKAKAIESNMVSGGYAEKFSLLANNPPRRSVVLNVIFS